MIKTTQSFDLFERKIIAENDEIETWPLFCSMKFEGVW